MQFMYKLSMHRLQRRDTLHNLEPSENRGMSEAAVHCQSGRCPSRDAETSSSYQLCRTHSGKSAGAVRAQDVDVPVVLQRRIPTILEFQKSLQFSGRVMDFPVVQQTWVPTVQTGAEHREDSTGPFLNKVDDAPVVLQYKFPQTVHLFQWSISPSWCGTSSLIHTVQKTVVVPHICDTSTRLSRNRLCCPKDVLLLSPCRQPAFRSNIVVWRSSQTVKFIDVAASRLPAVAAAASYSPLLRLPLVMGGLILTGLYLLLFSLGGMQWYGVICWVLFPLLSLSGSSLSFPHVVILPCRVLRWSVWEHA